MVEIAYNFSLLEDEGLKEAVRAFQAFRSENGGYSYKLFDVTQLPPSSFPHLLFVRVDREGDGLRLFVKIIGQMWLDSIAINPMGQYLDELPGTERVNQRLLRAVADKRAYSVRDTIDTGLAVEKKFEAAVFPLLDAEDEVVAIVSISVIDYDYLK